MTLVSFLCFLTCLGILALMSRQGSDVISPGKVFGFVWCLVVGLADLKLSLLQHSWSIESWFIVLLGPSFFVVGLFTVWVINSDESFVPISRMRTVWRESPINNERLFKLIVLAFLLFVVGYGAIILSGKEIPILSARPGRARLVFQLFGMGLFLHHVVWICFFTVVYHVSVRGHSGKKRILVLMSLVSLLLYAITLQRFLILMIVFLGLIFLYYTTRRIRLSYLSGFVVLGSLFFLWVSTLRGGQLFMLYLYVNSKMKFSLMYAPFTEPYMYFAMNVENFARAVDKMQFLSLGFFTFDFVAALTGLKHLLSSYYGLEDTPFLVSGYNTYTAFWTYYRDFGILGVSLIPFCLGILVGKIYYKMRRNADVYSITLYAFCVFTLAFSFYHNLISFLWYAYTLFGVVVILRLIRVNRKVT